MPVPEPELRHEEKFSFGFHRCSGSYKQGPYLPKLEGPLTFSENWEKNQLKIRVLTGQTSSIQLSGLIVLRVSCSPGWPPTL